MGAPPCTPRGSNLSAACKPLPPPSRRSWKKGALPPTATPETADPAGAGGDCLLVAGGGSRVCLGPSGGGDPGQCLAGLLCSGTSILSSVAVGDGAVASAGRSAPRSGRHSLFEGNQEPLARAVCLLCPPGLASDQQWLGAVFWLLALP